MTAPKRSPGPIADGATEEEEAKPEDEAEREVLREEDEEETAS